uniref:Uncharacterized protein n=1 Tax=Meleagris gallopavo TaxID=9103 RepID=A0A803YMI7_MELGA
MCTQKKKRCSPNLSLSALEENPLPWRFKMNWMNLQHVEKGKILCRYSRSKDPSVPAEEHEAQALKKKILKCKVKAPLKGQCLEKLLFGIISVITR